MEKGRIKQIALQFKNEYGYWPVYSEKFVDFLIEKEEFMTAQDYKRFRDEYKGEADLSALCCAVADAEKEKDLTIDILKADNEVMNELVILQRKRIEQLESNVKINEDLKIEMGNHMISFDYKTPELGRQILYLLGNGINGTRTCQLVRGTYHKDYEGDFSTDEAGKHIYATYWKYIDTVKS